MFIKPDATNPPVPYKVLIDVANFAPGYYAHTLYMDAAAHYKGVEYYEDDTSAINIFFSKKHPDMKLFKVTIDWAEFVSTRKVIVTNIDHVINELYEYLYWDIAEKGLTKDLHHAYASFMLKVFVVQQVERVLADITHLPTYSDYTWLKQSDAEGAEELDIGTVYVVYE